MLSRLENPAHLFELVSKMSLGAGAGAGAGRSKASGKGRYQQQPPQKLQQQTDKTKVPYRVVACRFFDKGRCSKGESCTFRHDTQPTNPYINDHINTRKKNKPLQNRIRSRQNVPPQEDDQQQPKQQPPQQQKPSLGEAELHPKSDDFAEAATILTPKPEEKAEEEAEDGDEKTALLGSLGQLAPSSSWMQSAWTAPLTEVDDHHSVQIVNSQHEFDKIIQQAENSQQLVVAEFHATWCKPCKFISPFYRQLSTQYQEARFVSVDIDQLPELSKREGVLGVPSFAFYVGVRRQHFFSGADTHALQNALERFSPKPTPLFGMVGDVFDRAAPLHAPKPRLFGIVGDVFDHIFHPEDRKCKAAAAATTTICAKARPLTQPPTPVASPEADGLCVICCDQKADQVIVPCLHQCLCKSCGTIKMSAATPSAASGASGASGAASASTVKTRCPICQIPILRIGAIIHS